MAIDSLGRETMYINSVTTKCGGPHVVNSSMDIGLVNAVSLNRVENNESVQELVNAATTYAVNNAYCGFPIACTSLQHRQTRRPLTTPAVLLVTRSPLTRIAVQQALTLQDFRGVASTYKLQAMICREGRRNQHHYSAELRI